MKTFWHKNFERTLILGTGPLAMVLLDAFRHQQKQDFGTIGLVTEKLPDERHFDREVLGEIADLCQIMRRFRPDLIIVALSGRGYWFMDRVADLSYGIGKNVTVMRAEDVYERFTGKLAIEALTPGKVMCTSDFFRSPSRWTWAARSINFLAALSLLIAFTPVIILIALALKLDSPGPMLFVQERIGQGGNTFKLIKFRTMYPTATHKSEWVRDNQDRITRVGAWLRRFRLDELPQLVNVIQGDMDLVGPRPHPASNFKMFVLAARNTPECGGAIPYYSLRSLVKPGITGWAQVRYQYANDVNEELEKLRYDLYYVKNASLWLDLRIVLETLKIVISGQESCDTEVRVDSPDDRVITRQQALPVPMKSYVLATEESQKTVQRTGA